MRPYERGLKGLGKPDAIQILAAQKTFEEAWHDQATFQVLNDRYDFKRVGTKMQRCRRATLYQVRFTRSHRALLAFSNDYQRCWWLDVFHKNVADQNDRISTACDRALRLLEHNAP